MNTYSGEFHLGSRDPIAIVGMACNLPGANHSAEDFWSFLLKKKCGITEIPADRWNLEASYDPNPHAIAKAVSKWGGFVENIREFDPSFFGISPREAASMDPQQRMVLQGAIEAIWDAQIPLEEFTRRTTGVFIGISQSDYRTVQELRVTSAEAFAGTGYALCINANRISHRLNLTGPSFAVDTACSSSLMALDQAVHNIRSGACEMALVGGVNSMIHPGPFLAFSKAGMISPTGQLSTFDASANGFVRGEGMGMVVLKSLSQAIGDGDRIHSVIHATSTNQDGATNTITAPSQTAQINMLRNLMNSVDIDAGQIGYVEAHGTGTPVGDPIEAGAIGTVIGQNSPDRPVWVGSSKANVGHLESGAGITGLIKATLAVKHGIVPPNIRFNEPNPNIPFDALNLRVPTNAEPFPEYDGNRYAVVNSFGFGGANASVLISSAPEASLNHHRVPVAESTQVDQPDTAMPLFFPLSAASEDALKANATNLLNALQAKGALADTTLRDLSAALATQREHLSHRAVILARSTRELKIALKRLAAGDSEAVNVITGQMQEGRKICFTFAGQGSQRWDMARDLLEHSATFAASIDAFDVEFQQVAGWSIREELMRDQTSTRIDDTTVTQPALFAIQTGLAAVWAEMGVHPDMVVGHSIGEAAASYLAGGLSLSGAAKFLSKRGEIRDQLDKKGAMAAVGMQPEDVEALLPPDGRLGIAAINGPGSTTISGDFDALHDFVEEFQMLRPDTFIRALAVDTAWHSYHLDAAEDWFRHEMASIDWSAPHLPFISTVSAQPETRFDTDYGWLNLRRPVNFQGAIETAVDLGATTFLELGPAATLSGPTKSTALEKGGSPAVLSSLSRKGGDFDAMAQAAASLFVQGIALDWATLAGRPSEHVELPGYAWQFEEFWQDSEESRSLLFKPVNHPFLGQPTRFKTETWLGEINLKAFDFLKDHRLGPDVIFPAAGYVDTIVAICRELFGSTGILELEDAIIHEALFIAPDQDVLLSTTFDPERKRVKVYSRVRDVQDEWVLRCEARVRMLDQPSPISRKIDIDKPGHTDVPTSYIYDIGIDGTFVNYGARFQTVETLRLSRSKTYAKVRLQDELHSSATEFHVHPTVLDGCLQVIEPAMRLDRVKRGRSITDPMSLPTGFKRMRVYQDFPTDVVVEAHQMSAAAEKDKTADFEVRDPDGKMLMTVEGVRIRVIPSNLTVDTGEEHPAHVVRQEIIEVHGAPEFAPEPGNWVVLEHAPNDATAIASALEGQGAVVHSISREALGKDVSGGLVDLIGDALEEGAVDGIIVTWPLSLLQMDESTGPDALFAPIEACVTDMISLGDMMDYARGGTNGLPKIVVLTSGAYPSPKGETQDGRILTQMPMAALVRGLATETPEYQTRVIDADADVLARPDLLALHILTPSPETEIILRADRRFVPRLQRAATDDFDPKLMTIPATDTSRNFHLTMRAPGVIDHLGLFEIPTEPVGPNQVRLQISAVGLNFRDIMAVTGLLPEEAEPEPAWQQLGLEYGALVVDVGANVSDLKPGDRVMGLGKRCLQRFMTVDARAVTSLPDNISMAEASTIPSAFATAHYALNHIGRMRRGERVFIHVATGGVGTAAVQLAQAAGAEIFATAGSPAKRKLLREMGVDHVMDSRSLKFADDVMRITKGRGVDILLNSLPGDYIIKGLEIMAPYGRFLEIGKRDVYEDASIGMKALRRNVSLSVLDLAAMGMERPDLMEELFAELSTMLENGQVRPLPVTEFPISQANEAIRYMSQAKHVGKVVVSLEEDSFQVRRDQTRAVSLCKDASYLITGGTAGFSLSIAEWLAKSGAGHLILASRTGKVKPSDARFVRKLEAAGATVTAMSLDATDEAAITALIHDCDTRDTPLRGIIHGAAVIKDGMANQLTHEMITDVLTPKISGAWALHRAVMSAGTKLDFMIGFSSISQIIGSAGQSNYIAGNAFLDALAYYRLGMGQPGVAINWGSITDAGFVARNEALASYMESIGLHGLRRREFGTAMEIAVARDAPSFVYSRAEWSQIARANTALGSSPRMASVLQTDTGGAQEVRARLMQLEGEALVDAARDFIMDEVGGVLKVERNAIQTSRPMSELGLDSLSSFELKVRIETALDFSLPVSKFLAAPSIDDLAVVLSLEIQTLKQEEIAALEHAESGEDVTSIGSTATRQVASNQQRSLLAAANSSMTSQAAREAMEHCVARDLPEGIDRKAVVAAMRRLARRHPLITLRIDTDGGLHFDGPEPSVIDGPNTEILEVSTGEIMRVCVQTHEPRLLTMRIHGVIGDASTCDGLADDLMALLTGAALPKAMTKRALADAVARQAYDPEDPKGQQDRGFWWYSLTGQDTLSPVPFARRSRAQLPGWAGRNHGAAKAIRVQVPADVSEARILRALATSLRQVTGSEGPVLIGRKTSLAMRVTGPFASALSQVEQPIVVPATWDDANAIARLDRVLANADQHTAFDSYRAAADFREVFDPTGVSPFQIAWEPNPVAGENVPSCALADLRMRRAKDGALEMLYDTDVMDEALAKAIAAALLEQVGQDVVANV